MKCSPGISNFLEETSSLSHSIVFLYFFALITEEGSLISLFYSLGLFEFGIQMGISFLSPLLFTSLLFTAIGKASSDTHFAFLHFFFLGMVLIPVSCTINKLINPPQNPKNVQAVHLSQPYYQISITIILTKVFLINTFYQFIRPEYT